MMIWVLRDYPLNPTFQGGSINRVLPNLKLIEALNQKGLFTYGGQPKPAVATVARLYKALPTADAAARQPPPGDAARLLCSSRAGSARRGASLRGVVGDQRPTLSATHTGFVAALGLDREAAVTMLMSQPPPTLLELDDLRIAAQPSVLVAPHGPRGIGSSIVPAVV